MRFCFRCLKRSNNALQDTLDGLGYFVGRRWGLTMIWSALLLLLLFTGLSQIKFADDNIDDIWAPGKSRKVEQARLTSSLDEYNTVPVWQHRGQSWSFILESVDGDSVLTEECIRATIEAAKYAVDMGSGFRLSAESPPALMFFLNSVSLDLSSPYSNTNMQELRDLSESAGGIGDNGPSDYDPITTVLDGMTAANIESRLLKLLETEYVPASTNSDDVYAVYKTRAFHQNTIGGVFCGSKANPTECGEADAAAGARYLRVSLSGNWNQEVLVEDFRSWMEALDCPQGYRWVAGKDQADQETDEVAKVVGIGVGIMVVWVCATIGGVKAKDGMPFVGLATVFTVLLSCGAAFGITSWFGVRHNMLSMMLPLIMLGIGVDDSYVLVGAFRDTPPALPTAKRIQQALRTAGLSVTMTSLTDVAALMIGSFSDVEAIRGFCITASACVLIDYVFQITLFMNFLQIDRRRARKGLSWWFSCCACCMRGSQVLPMQQAKFTKVRDITEAETSRQTGREAKGAKGGNSCLENVLEKYYAKLLSKLPVKIFVLIFFLGMTAFLFTEAINVQVGTVPESLSPADGAYVQYVYALERMFPNKPFFSIVFATNYVNNWADVATQNSLISFAASLQASKHVDADAGVVNFLDDYVTNYASNPTFRGTCSAADETAARTTQFYDCLAKYKEESDGLQWNIATQSATPGSVFGLKTSTLFKINDSNDGLVWAQFVARHSKHYSFDDYSSWATEMLAIDALVEEKSQAGGWRAFAYNQRYRTLERNAGYWPSARNNLLAAIGCCVVAAIFFVVNPLVAFLCTCMVILVDVWLLGTMTLVGMRLWEATVVCIVMAAGFAVDYSSHVGLSFMNSKGTGNERMQHAIVHSGRSIINAAFTTALSSAAMLMGSPAFKTFGTMLLFLVAYGLGIAIVFFPVVLSFTPAINLYNDGGKLDAIADSPSSRHPSVSQITSSKARPIAAVVIAVLAASCMAGGLAADFGVWSGQVTYGSELISWELRVSAAGPSFWTAVCPDFDCDKMPEMTESAESDPAPGSWQLLQSGALWTAIMLPFGTLLGLLSAVLGLLKGFKGSAKRMLFLGIQSLVGTVFALIGTICTALAMGKIEQSHGPWDGNGNVRDEENVMYSVPNNGGELLRMNPLEKQAGFFLLVLCFCLLASLPILHFSAHHKLKMADS